MDVFAILFGILGCLQVATGQTTSTDNFSCNRNAELLTMTSVTGTVTSPCYNSSTTYPEELTSGLKLVNITFDNPYIAGYRLTMRNFQLAKTDRLFVGEATKLDGSCSTIAVRNYTFWSNSTKDKIYVRFGEDSLVRRTMTLVTDDVIYLEGFETVIMDFYTVIDTTGGEGFLIDYAADISKCLMTGSDIYCKHEGKCTKVGFNDDRCDCSSTGYSGTTCENDIDECSDGIHLCADTGNCSNTDGGYDCICNPGYENGTGGPNCANIDECARETHDCHENAKCTDTIGSYTCTCDKFYTGNGTFCEDIDDCAVKPCNKTGICSNRVGGFDCICKDGYENGTNGPCQDTDECAPGGGNNCSTNADCFNTDGSFTCSCKSGFTDHGGDCIDDEECLLGTSDCHNDSTCTNTVGSFICTCDSGYSGNGTACNDIDECSDIPSPCHKNADCTNSLGSFTCACFDGYSGNGTHCDDIDECVSGVHNCDADASCTNIPADFFCTCKTGFTGNGENCDDINECLDPASNECDAVKGSCTNNGGSYTCSCKTGYTGDGITCTDVNECEIDSHNCTAVESKCSNKDGGFECICNAPRYRGTFGNCNYYCNNNDTCIKDKAGFIDVPLNSDGTNQYAPFDETFWKFQESSDGSGIRFTLKRFSTEAKDDFLSIYPGKEVNSTVEIVAISGVIGNLYNERDSVSGSGFIHRTGTGSDVPAYLNLTGDEPTLTLFSGDVFLAFTSDRLNTSTGFLLAFEYDVNDCPSPSRCQNGGACVDGTFAYQCEGCPGYEGVDCDLDVDECNSSTVAFPCEVNVDCLNTVGSYECTCDKPDYIGNASSCNPLIVLSNYDVQKTTSSLQVNFDITEAWRSADYIVSFDVTIARLDGGFTRTYSIKLTDLLSEPLVISGLQSNTGYSITVAVGERGSKFGSSVIRNDMGTQTFYTDESTPETPKNLTYSLATRDRVTLTWEKPEEVGFGTVAYYEVCYAPSTGSRTQSIAALRSITTNDTCMFLDDTYTSITLIGLPGYLDLDFKIRAYSTKGPGEFTTALSAYTGAICAGWENFAGRKSCDVREGLLLSDGFPRTPSVDSAGSVVVEQYWSFDLTSFPGWRPNFKYFFIVDKEATLDFGYGDINITDHDIEKDSYVASYTGNLGALGPSPSTGLTKNSSVSDQNTLWFVYISDRMQKQVGFQVEIEIDGDSCYSFPCLHGGICSNLQYDYSCDCSATDWRGSSCEVPYVEPTVTCTAGKRNATISFAVSSQWSSDETVIGGYTIELSSATASTSSMSKALGDTSADFTGITPYTNYDITVDASVSIRTNVIYKSGSASCRTLEDAPSVPRNVGVTSGNRSLDITWDVPSEPNGILSYAVSWVSTDHSTYGETVQNNFSSDLTSTSYLISGLRDYRAYDVTVTARTSGGSTAGSTVSKTTDPGAPPSFVSVNVTVMPNKSAVVDWALEDSAFIGPITITILPVSAIHTTAPAATVVVAGYPYSLTTYTYTSLEEAQVYNFTITASTGTLPDQTFVIPFVNTEATAPGQPGSFTYDEVTSTFSWTAPSVLDQNGAITGYKLTAVSVVPDFTTQDFSAATTSYQLNGMPPFTVYKFVLQAINAQGAGEELPLTITTREEVPETPSSITRGVITATSITVSWAVQTPPVGQTTYTVSYTGGGTVLSFETATNEVTITGLSPYTEYTITVFAKTNAGTALGITVTFQTAEDVPSAVQSLTGTFTPYTITVSWTPPSSPNGELTQYTVTWSSGSAQSVNVTGTSYTITGVTRSETDYTVQVTAWTSAGEGATEAFIVTTPKLLPNVPRNVAVDEASQTSVRVNADAPDNTEIAVTNYVITISQDASDCVQKKDTFCVFNDQRKTATLPYVVTGLIPFRKYFLSVASESEAGIGPFTDNTNFQTLAGVPNPATFTVAFFPGGITVTISAGLPFTGPASYRAVVTAIGEGGASFDQTVAETTLLEGIVADVIGLAGSSTFTVTVEAFNSQGTTQSVSPLTIITAPAAPTVTIERSSSSSLTIIITRDSTAILYTISYIETQCSSCNLTTTTTTKLTYTMSGLQPYTLYNVSIYATSNISDGETTTLQQRSRVGQPTMLDASFKLSRSSGTDASFQPAYNVILTNVCLVKSDVFDESEGPILSTSYFARQLGSSESASESLSVFYGSAKGEEPSPMYRALTIQCATSSRRKRNVVDAGVIIGADSSCPDNGDSECNGQLKPSTTYQFIACGFNEDGNYACTQPSDNFTTSAAPTTPGLTAGEIAAIVICSVVFVLLVILLIVFLVKRRKNRRGKHTVSRRGRDNPTHGASPSVQQRYQIDSAPNPEEEYSNSQRPVEYSTAT